MGKASSNKKVARAASIGGGRTAPSSKAWVWWAALAVVVVFGVAGILVSRADYRNEFAAGSSLIPPVAGRDHWHAAYGVFLCDEFAPAITDERDPKGIHTHGDGVIHIHPITRDAAGDNAVLGLFADAVRMTLTDEKVGLRGGKVYEEGETECDGKRGIVQVKVDGKVVTEDVRDIKLTDRAAITIAFAPKGAELPDPPSIPNLDNLDDVPNSGTRQTIPGLGPPEEGTEPAEGEGVED